MNSNPLYLELLSAHQSASHTCKVSLLDSCHRFGVDYYKFLSWYRTYKKHLPASISDSDVQLTPVHVTRSHPVKSGLPSTPSAPGSSAVISFRLKLGNGTEIIKKNTTLDSIMSLLEKIAPIC